MLEREVELIFDTRMPDKIPCDPFLPTDKADQQLRPILKQLCAFLSHRFEKWRKDDSTKFFTSAFDFDYPQSSFAGAADRPLINYRQPGELQDHVQVQPLSEQQLQSIKVDGTFLVKSRFYSIPYKWKLNEWIYKGSANILVQFKKDIAKAYGQIYQIPKRISSDYVSLKKGVWRLIRYFPAVINILIGTPKLTKQTSDPQHHLQLQRQSLALKSPQPPTLGLPFYQYIHIPVTAERDLKLAKLVQQRLQKLRSVDEQFRKLWVEIGEEVEDRILEQLPKGETEKFKYLLREEKYKILVQLIREKGFEETDEQVCEDFIKCFMIFREIQEEQKECDKKTKQQIRDYQTYIDNNHQIKRYAKLWREEKVAKYRNQTQQQNKKQMLENLRQKLNLPIFDQYCQFYHSAPERLKQISSSLPITQIPNRVFRCPYKLFPPYRVQQQPDNSRPNGFRFVLIRQDNKYVDTTVIGWKVALNIVRWITWSINVMYWLFRGLWGGRLGVKVLFGCKTFYPKYMVDPDTGVVGRDRGFSWDPVKVQVADAAYGITQSRREFQQSPDNGFFGKTCARVCNLIENYFFRLIIVIFFWLLLFKPIIIILNIIVCTLAACTAILWIPIIILCYGVFNLLIYNFDIDQRYPSGRYSQRFFPLICSALKFLYDLFYTLLALLLLLLHPLFALFILLFSVVRFLFRTLYDKFMFCTVSCCGRSPVRDTGIAWKISGPGLSRQYYQSVRENDVYVLVTAELERYLLTEFEKEVNRKLGEVLVKAQAAMNQVTSSMRANTPYNNFTEINDSIQFYQRKLNLRLSTMRNKFPQHPGSNVRFTQAQLQSLTARTFQIIKSFVLQKHQQSIFSKYQLKQGDYTRLTKAIWLAIFSNEEIFEPFENIDQRFELIDDREDELVNGVVRAIQGNVHLMEESKIPMLRVRKTETPLPLISVSTAVSYFEVFQGNGIPQSRHNTMFSFLVNFHHPDLSSDAPPVQPAVHPPDMTVGPLSLTQV